MCMQQRRAAKEKERDMQWGRIAKEERSIEWGRVTKRKEGEIAMVRGKGELMRK